MPQPALTPDEATLRMFLLGTLPPEEAERVSRWVEETPSAAEVLCDIDARDTVVDAIGEADTAAETSSAPHLIQTAVQKNVPPLALAGLPAEVGGYRVVRELGRGGMGIVVEAEDRHLNRRVAIKLIAAEFATSTEARERFLREARAVAKIEHENVVPILHVGESGGALYLVMPLLKGETLDARLKREKRLSNAELARIGREVAVGLAAAHAVGLVHRDVKPANIWLDAGTGRVRLLDFGLAKPLTDATDAALTDTGTVMGTPYYMAPEQAEGRPVDARSDLFSLGAVLYHAATGERPFKGDSKLAVLIAVKTDTPPGAETLSAELSPHLAAVIRALMEKDPAARPATATEVIERLSVPPAAQPVPVLTRRKSAPWRAIAAGVALVLVAAAATVTYLIRDKDGKVIGKIELPDGTTIEREPPPGSSLPPTPSPLDKLDPSSIPDSEREPWHPKGLVTVVGDSRWRTWFIPRRVLVRPDGKQLAVSDVDLQGNNGPTWLFDTATGRVTQQLKTLNAAGYSADGKTLVGTGGDEGAVAYDVSGKEAKPIGEQTIRGHPCPGIDAKGRYLLVLDGVPGKWALELHDLTKPKMTLAHKFPGARFGAVSPDSGTLAVVEDKTGTIELFAWDGKKVTARGRLTKDERDVLAFTQSKEPFAFDRDGRLGVQHADDTFRVWDVTVNPPKVAARSRTKRSDQGNGVVFAPDGKRVAWYGSHGVTLLDIAGDNITASEFADWYREFAPGEDGIWSVAWWPDGSKLVVTHQSGTVNVIDVTGSVPKMWNQQRRDTLRPGVGVTADGRVVGISEITRQPVVVALGTDPPKVEALPLRTGPVTRNGWVSPNGALVVQGNSYIRLDVPGAKWVKFKGPDGADILSADGKYGLTRSADGKTGELLELGATEPKVLAPVGADVLQSGVRARLDGGRGLLWLGSRPGEATRVAELWLLRDGKLNRVHAQRFEEKTDEWPQLSWIEGGREGTVFLAGFDGPAGFRRYEIEVEGERVKEPRPFPFTHAVAYSPDKSRFVRFNYGAFDVRVFDRSTFKETAVYKFPGHVIDCRFAPDGRHLLALGLNGVLYVLRLDPAPK